MIIVKLYQEMEVSVIGNFGGKISCFTAWLIEKRGKSNLGTGISSQAVRRKPCVGMYILPQGIGAMHLSKSFLGLHCSLPVSCPGSDGKARGRRGRTSNWLSSPMLDSKLVRKGKTYYYPRKWVSVHVRKLAIEHSMKKLPPNKI